MTEKRRKKRNDLNFNLEEYKELRAEVRQRFEYTRNLLLFLITSNIALLSFLVLAREALSLFKWSAFVFVVVGLSLTGFITSIFLSLHRQIYMTGSYLAVFHELGSKGFRWHWLSRFGYFEWINKDADWGKDPRRGIIFPLLVLLNWGGPIFILIETLIVPTCLEYSLTVGLLVIIALVLSAYIIWAYAQLRQIRKFMLRTLDNWMKVREKLEADSDWFDKKVKKQIADIRQEKR